MDVGTAEVVPTGDPAPMLYSIQGKLASAGDRSRLSDPGRHRKVNAWSAPQSSRAPLHAGTRDRRMHSAIEGLPSVTFCDAGHR
jgi:hypothetical protein